MYDCEGIRHVHKPCCYMIIKNIAKQKENHIYFMKTAFETVSNFEFNA